MKQTSSQKIKNDSTKNALLNSLKYGILIFCVFISVGVLFVAWGYFLNLSNAKVNTVPTLNTKTNDKSKKIQRIQYLKYSHLTDKITSYYLIQLIKIDGCQYIILSKTGSAPSIIHAASCKNHQIFQNYQKDDQIIQL